MPDVFLRPFLLVAYCALVIAPTMSEIYKVEVLDVTWKNLLKIISFNTPYVSLDELWSNIYQIPFIVERRSVPRYSKYVHLTIVTPGQPYVKINNEKPAEPNTNIYVADSVIFLSVFHPQYNVLCVTKDESPTENGRPTLHFNWKIMAKSKASGKTSVTGKKSILLDIVRTSRKIVNPNYIWREANWRTEESRSDSSADLSVWHNVNRIHVKAYDHNGKVTTDVKLLKDSKPKAHQQLNAENGVIYVDLENGNESGKCI
ncbi:hypothetical protein DdX_20001 [Ditylenchus destructor]|uniref:Uncharacterized protein n=1 Tax=Ditylenchus destructor TaxID=166010 RepID=A0AAD4QS20_9BILA|nr:hypothetical protein DdX_20001 [Ditylenchus destructor]